MKVFVTGSAGFIGFHVARRFLDAGHEVLGFDGFTEYYDLQLKRARNEILATYPNFELVTGMLEDKDLVFSTVARHQPELVIHLAAQAGVRYSLENPDAYIGSNVQGTFNLVEALKTHKPRHLLFASTSSVYGGNSDFPFAETSRVAFPVSLYAATKAACEALTHSYSHLHGIPTTCFRFFTVYGPWGRPDMALIKFASRMIRGEEIDVYGYGNMSRDFTYIDDLIQGIMLLSEIVPEAGGTDTAIEVPDSASPVAPWRVVNIAGGQPVRLMRFIEALENALGIEARKRMLPMQPGDVSDTSAAPELLFALTGFKPDTPVEEGVQEFVDWYIRYQHDNA